MKPKLLAFVAALVCCVLCIGAVTANAGSTPPSAKDTYDGILDFARGESEVQEWMDTDLAALAGTGAEWYILCLAQSGNYDFTAYEQALLDYLDKNTVPSATTKQKYALVLASIGSTDAYISQILDSTVGTLGIMSYVYGLHLVNNGYSAPLSAGKITDAILSMQKDDGGWAISGTVSDADVTAMTLQALAPYVSERQDVANAANRALSLLSERQTATGGYKSYGAENPESAAQVIIALCALGLDPLTDARFIKNGNTPFDFIATFALSDGGYAHTIGGAYSSAATAQVFCAATAYLRFAGGQAPLYALDKARPGEVQTVPDTQTAPQTQPEPPTAAPQNDLSYQPIACAIVLVLGGVVALVLIVLGKRHYKNFIALALCTALLAAAVWVIDVRLPEDYYNGQSITKQNPIGTVTLTIRCDAVPGLADYDYLPSDGIMLATETYEIEAGQTVYDILVEAARKHSLHLDASGAGDAMYVRGIGHLYEQAHGELSGWSYHVNGESPSMGCAAYTLSDGDEIVWEYTLTVGR